ncbi:hypothetical protein I7412_39415, partial [Frankia sp. CN6]
MIEPTSDEIAYDQERLRQFVRGEARAHGLSRRSLLRLLALATGPGAAVAAWGGPGPPPRAPAPAPR